jgi:hypothetical protein
MRILSDEPCVVKCNDNIAGGFLTLKFRLPTTEERIEYSNSQVNRKGGKIESIIGNTRMKFGYDVFIGFADGDFGKDKKTPISSDPASPLYASDWKDIIKIHSSDVITWLAQHVFENSLSKRADEEDPS